MRLLLVIPLCLAGCAPYTRVEMGLVEQARRGVGMWKEREAERDAAARAEFAARRQKLGEAFDADTRQRPPGELTPEWVIEARKAYAAGLEVLNKAEAAALAANETARANARATDEALQKLLWLESIELDLGTLFERREQP